MAVWLSMVLEEVGAQWSHAQRAQKVIRVVFFAQSIHEGTRDGARAVRANRHPLLLQKVGLAVRQSLVCAKSWSHRFAACLACETRAVLVEESAESRNSGSINQLFARATVLRAGRA